MMKTPSLKMRKLRLTEPTCLVGSRDGLKPRYSLTPPWASPASNVLDVWTTTGSSTRGGIFPAFLTGRWNPGLQPVHGWPTVNIC